MACRSTRCKVRWAIRGMRANAYTMGSETVELPRACSLSESPAHRRPPARDAASLLDGRMRERFLRRARAKLTDAPTGTDKAEAYAASRKSGGRPHRTRARGGGRGAVDRARVLAGAHLGRHAGDRAVAALRKSDRADLGWVGPRERAPCSPAGSPSWFFLPVALVTIERATERSARRLDCTFP